MRYISTLADQLSENLPPILKGSHSNRQLNTVVNICLALASELLGRKWKSSKLTQMQGISELDLAYDCIADIFQQNEENRLVQIEVYFSSVGVDFIDKEELLIHLRKFVYSRVNQAIFRIYQNVDPTLSKILRNLKIAVLKLGQFEEIDRFGEIYLAPVLCDRLQHMPPVDEDQIQRHLVSICTGVESIPQILTEIALYLRQQEDYARLIGMIATAKIIQSVYGIKNRPLLEEALVHPNYEMTDITSIISMTCQRVKHEMYSKYVQKHKVTEELFDTYFDTISKNMTSRFVGFNDASKTYFELLKTQLGDLTPKDYRLQHRSKLEYLGSLVHERVLKELQSDA